ncbi:hypothetical protein IFM89_006561 [Coptis chinensis]|uniref:Prefoldin subunit 6 n=1 Tax=Coptis chinensis TaxID=261450 RepID=A0A835MA34_9MAGN|nr:hypothetical protein IFM89_006561 [Coptis chinensis]
MAGALRELQRELENKANDVNKLQKDISKNHEVRKKYTIQLGENEIVLKELDLVKEDANVYKLIGPVLVKQDVMEANANVRKRIEYITAELKRLEGALQDMEGQHNSKKESIGVSVSSVPNVYEVSPLWVPKLFRAHMHYKLFGGSLKATTKDSSSPSRKGKGITCLYGLMYCSY